MTPVLVRCTGSQVSEMENKLHLQYVVLQEMAMRKVTRTLFEEDDDDMVRETLLIICTICAIYWESRIYRAERQWQTWAHSSYPRVITIRPEICDQILCVVLINAVIPTVNQQVAHSTCGDSEYNLRSRTVVCGSCGLPSEKSSNCSVSSASRSFRSGGLSEGLLPHSYVFSTSTPRKVGAATTTADTWLLKSDQSVLLNWFELEYNNFINLSSQAGSRMESCPIMWASGFTLKHFN